MIKSNKAITLIALIITIIVLLILAGVTINMVLGENGIVNKSKTSVGKYENGQNEEQVLLASYQQQLNYARDGVSLTQEEYNSLLKRINDLEKNKPSYTLLWEGEANKIGNEDSAGNKYKFVNSDMDIENYDFILIECKEVNSACPSKQSVLLSKVFISKNVKYDIRLVGYTPRSTDMHFVDNGFEVDVMRTEENRNLYLYITKIWGINF